MIRVGFDGVLTISTQITANWTANGNPLGTSYIAQISNDPNFGSITSSTTINTFGTFAALVPNTTYYMRVQAVNAGPLRHHIAAFTKRYTTKFRMASGV